MANLKRLKKDLLKLKDEEMKEVLDFLIDDEDKEEAKEVVETKKEVKVQTKEVKEQPEKTIGLTEEKLTEILKQFSVNFVTKDEIKEVKEKVEKVSNKAKPFGVEKKAEKTEAKEEIKLEDYLAKVNSQFV